MPYISCVEGAITSQVVTKDKRRAKAAGVVSVLAVILLPVVTGAIFFRLLVMSGVPTWFFIVQGLFFFASLAQALYFFGIGLLRALKPQHGQKDE